jgi:hypothetical protein
MTRKIGCGESAANRLSYLILIWCRSHTLYRARYRVARKPLAEAGVAAGRGLGPGVGITLPARPTPLGGSIRLSSVTYPVAHCRPTHPGPPGPLFNWAS